MGKTLKFQFLLVTIRREQSVQTFITGFRRIMKNTGNLVLLICVVFLIQETTADYAHCAKQGVVIGSYCYEIFTAKKSYAQATDQCLRAEGHLVMPISAKTLSVLAKELRAATWGNSESDVSFWVGINDVISEGLYTYINGSTYSVRSDDGIKDSVKWESGEPNNTPRSYRPDPYRSRHYSTNADCVAADIRSSLLMDDDCSLSKYFICEYSSGPCLINDIRIEHAEYSFCHANKAFDYGTTIPVKCHDGYVRDGPLEVTCLESRKWSEAPRCLRGCLPPRDLQHAAFLALKSVYVVGNEVTYVCKDGYVSNTNPRRSHSTIKCNESGNWVPLNSGCVIEDQYSVGSLQIVKGNSIALPCVGEDNLLIDNTSEFSKEISFRWVKNSEELDFTSPDYNIDMNGTLTLLNVSDISTGFYLCFIHDKALKPAAMGFDLKVKSSSCDVFHTKTLIKIFKEGESVLLLCPRTSDTTFNWFKEGERYYINGEQMLFPGGSLYFKNITFSNRGLYTCQRTSHDTLCAKNITYKVEVLASAPNVCGEIGDEDYPHPWAVSLWLQEEIAPFCYGTLIHEKWVVTSAQCLAGFNRKRKLDVIVRFGHPTSTRNKTANADVQVKMVRVHPKFSKKMYVNDLGLLQLKTPVRFSDQIRPICFTDVDLTLKLPCDQSPPVFGNVIGWGPLEKDDYDETPLLNETMTVIGLDSKCFSSELAYFETMFCSEKKLGSATTFAGDAGSAFELKWKGKTYLLGVFSWGERASLLGEYDYFTKIAHYFSWLKSFVDEDGTA